MVKLLKSRNKENKKKERKKIEHQRNLQGEMVDEQIVNKTNT
jgi:hypothetical protein